MEEEGMLNPPLDHDFFIHFFTTAWNQHPIRTEQMWSPKKVWMNGVLREAGEGHQIPDPTPDNLYTFECIEQDLIIVACHIYL